MKALDPAARQLVYTLAACLALGFAAGLLVQGIRAGADADRQRQRRLRDMQRMLNDVDAANDELRARVQQYERLPGAAIDHEALRRTSAAEAEARRAQDAEAEHRDVEPGAQA